jgi:phage shock protein C
MIMDRQLHRSKTNRVISGVCGGFAEYFSIDPTIIRIICIIISLSGTGILAYIVAAIIMPDERKASYTGSDWKPNADTWRTNTGKSAENDIEDEKDNWDQPVKYNSEKNRLVMGAILVGLGVLFLGKQIMPWFDLKYLIPMLLIGVGGFIIYKGRR